MGGANAECPWPGAQHLLRCAWTWYCDPDLSLQTKLEFGPELATPFENTRNKGAAARRDRPTIRRQDLEAAMLDALANNLMDPEAVQLFCEEYAAELNCMQAAATAGRAGLEKEMAQVTRDHRKLVDAIIACVPGEQVKDRMVDLDTRRKEIERRRPVRSAPVSSSSIWPMPSAWRRRRRCGLWWSGSCSRLR